MVQVAPARTSSRLRGIDLNLLVPLAALLDERNVTRAGLAVNMSQPAMSASLGRLRVHFGDELLRRVGRGYELTPFAEEVLPDVRRALAAVGRALVPGEAFDPATSDRRFTVSISDYATALLVEPLVAVLGERAPGVTVDFDPVPSPGSDQVGHLMRRDLVVGALGYQLPGRRRVAFRDRFVCIVDADNPHLVGGALSLRALAEVPHAVATFGGAPGVTPADSALAEAGVEQRVALTVPGLLVLPFVVAGTDLCAFVPERLVRRSPASLHLVVADVPLPEVPLVEAAHWHPSRSGDAALQWLLGVVGEAAGRL